MGVLIRPRAGLWALGGLAAVVVVGCAVLDAVGGGEEPRRFDHRVHVVDEGLDCFLCHLGAEDDEEPGMPALGQCRLCHDEPETEADPDPTRWTYDDEGNLAHASFSALSGEVVFSHLAHVERGATCADCHGDVGESTEITSDAAVSMAACVDCHERTEAPGDCATCHTEIDTNWTPPNHLLGWQRAHGPVSCERSDRAADQCELCHSDQSCTSCHLETPPSSHTNYWRRRGHGALAALDRDSCATCHTRDSCQECHSQSRPMSHVGLWGGKRNNHCVGCHLPSSMEESCFLCHEGAPSHALAPPKPPGHAPGMNCRQCHGQGAPLAHIDNGDDCNACHK